MMSERGAGNTREEGTTGMCATFSPSRLGSKLALKQKTRQSLEIFPKCESGY